MLEDFARVVRQYLDDPDSTLWRIRLADTLEAVEAFLEAEHGHGDRLVSKIASYAG